MTLTQKLERLVLPLAVLATSLSTACTPQKRLENYEFLNDKNTPSYINPVDRKDYLVLATGLNRKGGVGGIEDLTGIVQGKIIQGTPFIISAGVDKNNDHMGLNFLKHDLEPGQSIFSRHTIRGIYNSQELTLFNPEEGAIWSFPNGLSELGDYSVRLVRGKFPKDFNVNNIMWGASSGQRVIRFQVVPQIQGVPQK